MRQFEDRLNISIDIIPFEFDPPGTYPAEGLPLLDYYIKRWGPGGRRQLEERKQQLSGIGMAVGINFRFDRSLVNTTDVNTALMLARDHGVACEFADRTLSSHFESCENPNNPDLLRSRLRGLGVPDAKIEAALTNPRREAENYERTAKARVLLTNGGVPSFQVRCDDGEDLCASTYGSATSPAYFQQLFSKCLH